MRESSQEPLQVLYGCGKVDLEGECLEDPQLRLDDAGSGVAVAGRRQESLRLPDAHDAVVGAELTGQLDARDCSQRDLVLEPRLHLAPVDGAAGPLRPSDVFQEFHDV